MPARRSTSCVLMSVDVTEPRSSSKHCRSGHESRARSRRPLPRLPGPVSVRRMLRRLHDRTIRADSRGELSSRRCISSTHSDGCRSYPERNGLESAAQREQLNGSRPGTLVSLILTRRRQGGKGSLQPYYVRSNPPSSVGGSYGKGFGKGKGKAASRSNVDEEMVDADFEEALIRPRPWPRWLQRTDGFVEAGVHQSRLGRPHQRRRQACVHAQPARSSYLDKLSPVTGRSPCEGRDEVNDDTKPSEAVDPGTEYERRTHDEAHSYDAGEFGEDEMHELDITQRIQRLV